MNLEILSRAKAKLKKHLKDDEILDIVVFGSSVKGTMLPNDIDIAIISDKIPQITNEAFHISQISPTDFFIKRPAIITTLFREGYSLKHNIPFAELYKFSSKVMYVYTLSGLNPSAKVRTVNILRGRKGRKGIVEEKKGTWLANQVFTIPPEADNTIEKLMSNLKVHFKKYVILIH